MNTPATASPKALANPRQRIVDLLGKQQEQITRALPKFLTAERFTRVALTTINKTPKLLDCTESSLMACLMDCAQLGLEPDNVMGRAYLIPFKDVCTLVVGYKGLIALAYRSGDVKTIMAQVVCENDEFDFEFGLNQRLSHKPALSKRGDVVAVYAYGLMESGQSAFDVMSIDDVERIRGRSRSANNGPWVTDWDEMARKTVVKRLAKYLPLSAEFMEAVVRDNENEHEEEQRIKAARPVLSAAPVALEDGESIPFPQRDSDKVAVPVESSQSIELTAEEKAGIERHEAEEAARQMLAVDPEGALTALMAIDKITPDELKTALLAFHVKVPANFDGPSSLTDKSIATIAEPQFWSEVVKHINTKVRV